MEEALAKIRPHTSSSLAHQKAPANLLHALESTLEEKGAERTPTAYFAAIITTLDGTLQKKETTFGEGDLLPAELYLLALVAPFAPHPVVQTNLNTLLSLTSPLFPALASHAPPLRSQLTLYNSIFRALDRSQLDVIGVRRAFATILQLCLDPRPKVRKRAADLVNDVLSNPPSPLLRHPYAQRVAEWMQISLHQACSGVLPKAGTSKNAESSSSDTAIHLLALLRPILQNLPLDTIPSITTALLSLPRLGNPYLTQSAYSILSDLLSASVDSGTQSGMEQIPAVLSAVITSPPPKSDATVTPSWLGVLGDSMLAYHAADPEGCAGEFSKVWSTVWAFFETSHVPIRKAVAKALESLASCITLPIAQTAVKDSAKGNATLRNIIAQITRALDSLAYAQAIPELLQVVSSLITNLDMRVESGKSIVAAEVLLLPLVRKIADLRTLKNFEHKEGADAVISTALKVVGPAVLLEAIPLNLEPQDRLEGREPRAFLLPMLSQSHPSPLGHFVSYFVPLSERMFNLQKQAESEGRQSEGKVWSVLVSQVWAGFAGFCYETPDVKEALTPAFSQLLSQLLYSQPDLRPPVLKGLRVLVESSLAVMEGDTETTKKSAASGFITREEAAQNVAFLKTRIDSWFAVFFNVFGSVDRDSRGLIGDVINVWADLAGVQDISRAYHKVVELFRQNLQNLAYAADAQQAGVVVAMTQDLLILLLPFLEAPDVSGLFQVCLAEEVLCCRDSGVQKRGYKILAKSLSGGKLQVDPLATFRPLEEFTNGLSAAAKKDRFVLLKHLVPGIPSTALHVIPSLIPEAVLGTKEPSEKARFAAFELIVAMGRKMNEGGIVKRQMLDGMDEDGAVEAKASINEYMTMVAGGLAGASPHTISATVTAISRLVFEFKDKIDLKMQTEIFTTMLVFMSSSNREIVKSTLGYVKLAIHTLSPDLLRPHLCDLVPALLKWSHDHKNHFKAKVRHIFERMIRRFGWNDVHQAAGEDQAAKVLTNIKKRKDRAKRRKAREDEAADEEVSTSKVVTGDAFEDILYGSESELDDSEDDERPARSGGPKHKGAEHGVRLRVDDDEPMDLLEGAASRLTNMPTNRRRKPGQDAGRFETEVDTGKILIPGEESDSDIEVSARKAAKDVAGSAYRESVTSVDGFTRGPNGRIKFNKDTKKRRRDIEDEDGDVEMADGETPAVSKNNKRRSELKLGHEFKAKKAGGDVKKGSLDPYAYLPLSQAAKRKGKRGIGIAGKK
ncbi:armadillo-type protein [Phlebopus sp. FC_14]|nr:armadillo-type protein [Phlebopus sp. FC_14]